MVDNLVYEFLRKVDGHGSLDVKHSHKLPFWAQRGAEDCGGLRIPGVGNETTTHRIGVFVFLFPSLALIRQLCIT
jgi:hypothetical protein